MARSCIEVPWAGGLVRVAGICGRTAQAVALPRYQTVSGDGPDPEQIRVVDTLDLGGKAFFGFAIPHGGAAVSSVLGCTGVGSKRRRPGSPRRPTTPVRSHSGRHSGRARTSVVLPF